MKKKRKVRAGGLPKKNGIEKRRVVTHAEPGGGLGSQRRIGKRGNGGALCVGTETRNVGLMDPRDISTSAIQAPASKLPSKA